MKYIILSQLGGAYYGLTPLSLDPFLSLPLREYVFFTSTHAYPKVHYMSSASCFCSVYLSPRAHNTVRRGSCRIETGNIAHTTRLEAIKHVHKRQKIMQPCHVTNYSDQLLPDATTCYQRIPCVARSPQFLSQFSETTTAPGRPPR